MSLFFASFILVYGGMHFYAFRKARSALHFGSATSAALIAVMVLMIAAPLLVRWSERAGMEGTAVALAYVGYSWMGFLFLFFSASLAIDLCRFFVYLAGLVGKVRVSPLVGANRWLFLLTLLFALVAGAYGYFEALRIRVDRVVISTPKIPAAMGTLRIVQISDVHLGIMIRDYRLARILEAVRKADPHILVATGDLVDGQINGLKGLVNMLRALDPPYGKFAITGNHEYYAGIGATLAFTEKTGFRMLRGEAITVGDLVNLAGVDDIAGKSFGRYVDVSEKDLLSPLPRGLFTILLKHRPVVDREAEGLFDLQLSGHVHKGQIFPFRFLTRLFFPYVHGLFTLKGKSLLYVNRGSGTWGPPIRFLASPEVTVIELVHEGK